MEQISSNIQNRSEGVEYKIQHDVSRDPEEHGAEKIKQVGLT